MERLRFADLNLERPEAEKEEVEFFDQFVIPQNNTFIFFWNAWIVFLSIFGSFAYFYFAAFRIQLLGAVVAEEVSERHELVSLIIETSFFIDIFLNFFKEYTPEGSSKPVGEFQKVSGHYLSTTFILDVIVVIPF